MYIQAVCHKCGRSISFDYSLLNGETILRCPVCRAAIHHNDASHLFALVEKYKNAMAMLKDIDIIGVFDGKGSRVVEDDSNSFEMMYHKADPDLKGQIEGIIDHLYLTLNGAMQNGNRNEIAQISDKMKTVFNWYIEQNDEGTGMLLGE